MLAMIVFGMCGRRSFYTGVENVVSLMGRLPTSVVSLTYLFTERVSRR